MAHCKDQVPCWEDRVCRFKGECVSKVITNADRIRAMSDRELAEWICGGAMQSDSACSFCENNKKATCNGEICQYMTDAEIIMVWLQQPSEVV